MDAQTFQQEAMKLERLLYHICYGMLHNQSDCEDAIQEALLRAWKNRHQLRDMEHFRSWLCRITANACQDVLRKRQHEGVYDDAMADNQPASIDLEQMVLRDALSTLSPNKVDSFDTRVSETINLFLFAKMPVAQAFSVLCLSGKVSLWVFGCGFLPLWTPSF